MNDYELMHYGVKGMKWGVRRQTLKQQYRSRTNKAFSQYEREIARIEKPYKIGQKLSDRDQARESAADKRYQAAAAKAKSDYKSAVKASDAKFKDYRQKVRKSRSTGAKVGTFLLTGPFGNRAYNSALAAGAGKGEAMAMTALGTILGGPVGNLAVSAYYKRAARTV